MKATNDNDAVLGSLVRLIDERIATALAKHDTKPANDMLTTAAAAKLASVSISTIRRWVREKHLTKHIAHNRVRIKRVELERYLSGAPVNETPAERARRRAG